MKKRSSEEEGGGKPMADANINDVLAMSVLYIFYYSGEIILVAFQTVIIMYLRRSRIVLGLVFAIFALFGAHTYSIYSSSKYCMKLITRVLCTPEVKLSSFANKNVT